MNHPKDTSAAAILSRLEHIENVLTEVLSQVGSLAGQAGAGTAPPSYDETRTRNVVCAGDLRIDIDGRCVTLGEVDIPLTAVEFGLLAALVERRDTVVRRGTLLVEVWQRSELTKTRTVDTHVKRLRDQLGSARRYIQTVRGLGYRFSDHPCVRRARPAGRPCPLPSDIRALDPASRVMAVDLNGSAQASLQEG